MGLLQAPTSPLQDPRLLFQDLAALRQRDRLHYSTQLEAYVVTRYNDIIDILDQPDVFSSKPTVPIPPPFVLDKIGSKCPMRGTLLGHDNPDHDRLRQSVNSFFVPRRLKRFEPLIETLAHELLDDIAATGSANVKAQFALPLPLKVISAVAGLDPADWKWVARSLTLFGGHRDFALPSFEEQLDAIVDIHERIAGLIQKRRLDRRDDLISHIWNERDTGKVIMTDFEHLSMIPGLLLAGHETTTNLLSMGLAHLLHHELWPAVSETEASRAAALEELLRYESAITGMRRLVTQPCTIGSTTLKPGDQLFLAYNSGSRDETHFPGGDLLDISRKSGTQHLGFGRGIHACLGAPLARILLQVELRVLYERLPGLRIVTPYTEIEYEHVHEGRTINALDVAWDADAARTITAKRKVTTPQTVLPARTIPSRTEVQVQAATQIATNVLLLTLTAPPGDHALPHWTPGAHIDVPVGTYGWRQYSLCSDPSDSVTWQIAVLLEVDGSGGSRYMHRHIRPGQRLRVGGPRNHFPLTLNPTIDLEPQPQTQAGRSQTQKPLTVLIAAGIGITPIRAMYRTILLSGAGYRVLYLGRTRAGMAFLDDFDGDDNVEVWAKEERGAGYDLECFARDLIASNTQSQSQCGAGAREGADSDQAGVDTSVDVNVQVYACGPSRLLEGVQTAFGPHIPSAAIHIEHFANPSALSPSSSSQSQNRPFAVLLARSNRTLHVPADKSLLTALNEADVQPRVMSTCERGTCGTCEVGILKGGEEVEHRDTVLTTEERVQGRSMMSCVSRCNGQGLMLDLW